ncbi:hypothetical protein IG631_04135 [Alternaria alternata]|nr:hypothetical protein IG631_04135 [Alternaria alternata]
MRSRIGCKTCGSFQNRGPGLALRHKYCEQRCEAHYGPNSLRRHALSDSVSKGHLVFIV